MPLHDGSGPNHLNHPAWRLPLGGRRCRPLTFLDTVARDVGLDIGDLGDAMLDHKVSRKIVDDFSIVDRPK